MKVFRPVKISEFKADHSPEIKEVKTSELRKARANDKGRPPRPELSAGEIRERFEELKTRASSAKRNDLAAKKVEYQTQIGESDTVPPVKTADEVLGDVGLNDPKDPMTTEKLKSVLTSGGINFSAKEREVLEGILGQ